MMFLNNSIKFFFYQFINLIFLKIIKIKLYVIKLPQNLNLLILVGREIF